MERPMNGILELRNKLTDDLLCAVKKAIADNELPEFEIPEITLERPQNASFGDYATSLPLKLTKLCRMKPMDIANAIVKNLPEEADIKSITVVNPGFINFSYSDNWLTNQVADIIEKNDTYGNVELGKGEKVQIEFVSANPTGPLHIGHGRGAVLGSTIANVLAAAGYDVQKEYYINDAGNQIHLFSESLWIRYCQSLGEEIDMIEDGYQGQYMRDLGKELADKYGKKFLDMGKNDGSKALCDLGLPMMLDSIKESLEKLNVTFDLWFSEKSLFANGQYDTVMKILEEKGYLSKHDGALWFTSTSLGESKDNVIIRSDGTVTYFGTDIAYHYNKFAERGFDRVIDIWGADHQGHISRMKTVLNAIGLDGNKLDVLISQLVSLKRGNEVVKFSKRSGEMITLSDLIEEVGADACRFFFLTRSADSQMEFDLDLAQKESSENPVFYVQYAHARIASILKNASDIKGTYEIRYSEPQEFELIRKMLQLPEIIELSASTTAPHHLPHYAMELATAFHAFYHDCRVISQDDPRTSYSRLKLAEAAKIVLARTLRLMGMNAPESM